jgi:hypothetical protein
MLTTTRDQDGVLLCYKTSMLEFIGILLPFVMIPEMLINKYVIVKVDNLGCYFGWLNKQLCGDSLTSLLIRTLHVISHRISCTVHIEHLPRMSTPDAVLVDRLSRESTTSEEDKRLLKKFDNICLPKSFVSWLKSPTEDWDLPQKIVNYLFK